jgi:hypothetical protein
MGTPVVMEGWFCYALRLDASKYFVLSTEY